jgi:hypothetical protein
MDFHWKTTINDKTKGREKEKRKEKERKRERAIYVHQTRD